MHNKIFQPKSVKFNQAFARGTELNLEQILEEVWAQGLPNGILNSL